MAEKYLALLRKPILVPGWLVILITALSASGESGLQEGRLRPCPDRPNCVSSEPGDRSPVLPLTFSGSPDKDWNRLKSTVRKLGGTIEEDTNTYLRATFTSRIFRFVDDVEFRLVPEEGIIHVRSASRVGYSDFGVNRKRAERLRAEFGREAYKPQGD